jgi:hypothetical protein
LESSARFVVAARGFDANGRRDHKLKITLPDSPDSMARQALARLAATKRLKS